MLQRDYIMRLIQLFFEAVAKFVRSKEGKDQDTLRLELDNLYKTFLKYPRGHFSDKSIDEIIHSFNEEDALYRIEIAAELIYQEALLGGVNKPLLKKALALFEYVDLSGETFSFDRQRKVGEIKSLLSD